MSNQLWQLVGQSLSELEAFFEKFQDADSEISIFHIKLNTSGTQIRFEPQLSDIEAVVVSILDEIVLVVGEIPRIETKLFTSLSGERLYLPSISINDERIADGKSYRKIILKNAIGPQRHLMSYEKYKGLLNHKSEKKIEDFLRERHELEDFELVYFS